MEMTWSEMILKVRGADMEVIEMGTANMVDTTAGESKQGGGNERTGEGLEGDLRERVLLVELRMCGFAPPTATVRTTASMICGPQCWRVTIRYLKGRVIALKKNLLLTPIIAHSRGKARHSRELLKELVPSLLYDWFFLVSNS